MPSGFFVHFNKKYFLLKIILVVLDDFIRIKLIENFPKKLSAKNIIVVHHPIITTSYNSKNIKKNTVCFIGYRTKFKGYNLFAKMAFESPRINFLAIGDGKVENIRTGVIKRLNSTEDYLTQISECSLAFFLYTGGYSCTLSAAAMDASLGFNPFEIYRFIFSTITIELSTRRPRATTRAAIDICCKPYPKESTILNPIRIDKGIAMITTRDDLTPKANRIIIPTSIIPCTRFHMNPLMRLLTPIV